jgi:hypothetical protein
MSYSFQCSDKKLMPFLTLHWKLYDIHIHQGNMPEAKQELGIILGIDPKNLDAQKKLEKLSK